MSGIYISNMEMPRDCPMCPLAHWDFTGEFRGCKVVCGKKYAMETEPGYPETNFRPSWCPLVPVPEHGRLGDLDELLDRAFGCLDEETFLAFQFLVNGSVTVIPPSKEET